MANNIAVDVTPPPSVSFSFPAPNIAGPQLKEEYKTDDADELIQGVHIPHKIAQGAYPDGELTQGDWFFGYSKRHPQVLTNGDSTVPVMEARSILAWNEWFTNNPFPTKRAAYEFGIKLSFIGVLKATRGPDSYHSFTVGRRAFNVINYWQPTKNDPVRPQEFLWVHLVYYDAAHGHFLQLAPDKRIPKKPTDEPIDAPIEVSNCVRRWRVARVQHADAVALNAPYQGEFPLREPAANKKLDSSARVQLSRAVINSLPRIPIVLVGSRFWA